MLTSLEFLKVGQPWPPPGEEKRLEKYMRHKRIFECEHEEVYKRLIKQVSENEGIEVIDALIKVYRSFISTKIDDYNSSVYYENPSYIYESYRENKML